MTTHLGNLGESLFRVWCDEAGLVRNKAEDDRGGWDFVVEGPVADGPRTEHDPTSLNCIVQVKTTASASGRARCIAKVSNWKRLADTPNPAFCLVIGVHGVRPAWARLVHVEKGAMATIYRRVRELRLAADDRLHAHEVKLPLEAPNVMSVTPLGGAGLLSALQDFIGDPTSYAARKQSWRQTVGYEAGNVRVDFGVRGSLSLLADWAIGWESELPIDVLARYDTRLGSTWRSSCLSAPRSGGSRFLIGRQMQARRCVARAVAGFGLSSSPC